MMSLYPTFEDLKVDNMLKAQGEALLNSTASGPEAYSQLASFMGMTLDNFEYNDLGELVPKTNVLRPTASPYSPGAAPPVGTPIGFVPPDGTVCVQNSSRAIVESNHSRNPAEIQSGVRRVVACKGANGKLGVQLINVENGVFVSLVQRDSPAALAGLRFGDQVLSINGNLLAGKSGTKAMELIKKGPSDNIEMLIRDRPFERTISMYKSSTGFIGLSLQDGMIKAIHKDSSAARNGVLTNHQIVEVNGQNVMGMKDKELTALISSIQGMLTLTILPAIVYEHLVKNLRDSTIRKQMDRSMPEV